jgi:hypothetical protein
MNARRSATLWKALVKSPGPSVVDGWEPESLTEADRPGTAQQDFDSKASAQTETHSDQDSVAGHATLAEGLTVILPAASEVAASMVAASMGAASMAADSELPEPAKLAPAEQALAVPELAATQAEEYSGHRHWLER